MWKLEQFWEESEAPDLEGEESEASVPESGNSSGGGGTPPGVRVIDPDGDIEW